MTRRHGLVAKHDVALATNKRRTLAALVNLVIKNPTIICRSRDVATFGAAT